MKNQTMIAKTIGLQKTTFVATISIISTMQQHGEDLLKTSLGQTPWLSGSSKRACLDMTNFYSKYWDNFKSVTDQSFEALEKISSPERKNETKEAKATEQTSISSPAQKKPTARKKTPQVKKIVKAKASPKNKSVAESVPTEKPVTLEKPVQPKPPEQAKAIEVKAERPILKASRPSQQKTPPAIGDKKPTAKLSLPTKDNPK